MTTAPPVSPSPEHHTSPDWSTRPAPLAGPILTYTLASSVALWVAAFITHLPWINLPQRAASICVLVVWLIASVCVGRRAPLRRHRLVTTLSGLFTALLGLLILGALLTRPLDETTPAPGAQGLIPSAPLIAAAFVALGAVIGFVGGLMGLALRPRTIPRKSDTASPRDWLCSLAVVVCVAVVPLLIIGGSVTSTESGMAIIGWPDSYTANMFLYPLALMGNPSKFLEHTHRLFGSLVGICTAALMVYTFIATAPTPAGKRTRLFAVLLFAFVVAQGIAGGVRVRMGATNPEAGKHWALLHGIVAQLFFAAAVGFAARIRPVLDHPLRDLSPSALRTVRQAALFAKILLPSAIIQLALGATYRHLGQPHALWSHIGFSVLVVIFALLAGFSLTKLREEAPYAHAAPALKRVGMSIVHVVGLQFLLGWAALWATGVAKQRAIPVGAEVETSTPVSLVKAAIVTVHQANGALVLACAALIFVFARWARRAAAK